MLIEQAIYFSYWNSDLNSLKIPVLSAFEKLMFFNRPDPNIILEELMSIKANCSGILDFNSDQRSRWL